MDTLALLQHYWWFLISLLGALLVFLLFVQGGQSLLYTIGRTEHERNLIVNSLGRKWELTFTTLVTFGGAFFASFPLFYSTSFGGAHSGNAAHQNSASAAVTHQVVGAGLRCQASGYFAHRGEEGQ